MMRTTLAGYGSFCASAGAGYAANAATITSAAQPAPGRLMRASRHYCCESIADRTGIDAGRGSCSLAMGPQANIIERTPGGSTDEVPLVSPDALPVPAG